MKAQEEMVGFAILVIIVSIIGVIFLAFSLRSNSTPELSSLQVQQFSESLVKSTTECNLGAWPALADFATVIDTCYNSPEKSCLNGKNACSYLNLTIPSIIKTVWNIAPESPYNGASYKILFKDRVTSQEKEVVSSSFGNCTSDSLGGESIIPDSKKKGNLIVKINICLSK